MSELDKTIEELEAEVQSELDEMTQDAPKKGAAKSEPMDKVEGEVQDLGKAVDNPDEKKGPDAAKATKKVSDAQTKGAKDAGGADTPTAVKEPLAAETEIEHDGEELEEMAMTKEMMKAEMMKKMEMMKAKELKAMYNKMEMMGKEEEEKSESKDAKVEESTLDERIASVDVSDDVSALTQDEELSEEFKTKAATIFEAAVKSKIRSEVERIEMEKVQEIAEEINTVRDELTEKVDNYMNYVVEEWMKENEIAIERGLKGDIAESFMTGLRGLFEDHYISVPDDKYDLLEGLYEKISGLETKLDEQIQKNTELNKDAMVSRCINVFNDVAEGLTEVETEKLQSLAEGLEYESEDQFRDKLTVLRENYFDNVSETNELANEIVGDTINESAEEVHAPDGGAAVALQACLSARRPCCTRYVLLSAL